MPAALVRFKKESLVGFDDAAKFGRLAILHWIEEAMTPTKRRAFVDAESGGNFPDAQPINQTLGVLLVQFRIVQTGKRGAGRDTESFATNDILALEALPAVLASPFNE